MGLAKRDWMKSCERGYESLEGQLVCINCIEEYYLRELHSEDSESGTCDFCGETEVLVADAEIIQSQIMESLMADYENIEDAGAPYETAEGGWQIGHQSAQEIVTDEIYDVVSEQFGNAIVEAIDIGVSWTERDWAILSPIARMRHGWNQFCSIVQNQLRFSFAFVESDEDSSHPDYTHPSLTLREIGKLVENLNLVRELPTGTLFYRIRVDKAERFTTFEALGSPPSANASANRMSPAGIPMLYGAEDIQTAIEETWDGESPGFASIATIRTTQPIRVIDFTDLPDPPSYWSNPDREIFADYRFLHELAADLSKPVERGSKVDLAYAPTQIVSEYLTKAWRGLPRAWNPPPGLVHGLCFKSSITGMRNFGLNFLRNTDSMYGLNQADFLELVQVEHRELSPI